MKTLHIVAWTRADHHYISIHRVFAGSEFEAVADVLVMRSLESAIPREGWRIEVANKFASYETVPSIETLQEDLRPFGVYFNVQPLPAWGSYQLGHRTRSNVETNISIFTTDQEEGAAARSLARCLVMSCSLSNLDAEAVFKNALEEAREERKLREQKRKRRGDG